jgi:hypothetical protein
MKKKIAALMLALGLLSTTAGAAYADTLGTETFNWPGSEVTVRLSILTARNLTPGQDMGWGRMIIEDLGADNVYRLELTKLQLMIDRAPRGGTSSVLRGSPGDDRLYTVDTGLPGLQNVTYTVPCLHDDQFPSGITHGDTVWVRAEYRIHWNNGLMTPVRVDESNFVTFTLASQCG